MIGAHNALTAHNPRKWWMKLFLPFYCCQSLNIYSLIEEGVRFFDIRIAWRNLRWYAAHGIIDIDIDPLYAIDVICKNVDYPIIRLILERGDEIEKSLFISTVSTLESKYPNAKFIGGNYKPTWQKLFSFERDDIHDNIDQYVGSMDEKFKWFGSIVPYIYAKIFNRVNLTKAQHSRYSLFDFI